MRLQSKAAGEASTGRRETQRAREDQSMNGHSLLQLTPKTKYFSCVLLTLPRGHRQEKSTQLSCGQLSFSTTSSYLSSFCLSLLFLIFLLHSFPFFLSSVSFFLGVPLFLSFSSFFLLSLFSQWWCGEEGRAWWCLAWSGDAGDVFG